MCFSYLKFLERLLFNEFYTISWNSDCTAILALASLLQRNTFKVFFQLLSQIYKWQYSKIRIFWIMSEFSHRFQKCNKPKKFCLVNFLRFSIFMEGNLKKKDPPRSSKPQTNKGFIMYSLCAIQMFNFTHACKNKGNSQKRGIFS